MSGISLLKFQIIKKCGDMFYGMELHKKTDNQSYVLTMDVGKYVWKGNLLI